MSVKKVSSYELWKLLAPALGLEDRGVTDFTLTLKTGETAKITLIEHLNYGKGNGLSLIMGQYELVEKSNDSDDCPKR